MDDSELNRRLDVLEKKVDAAYASADKARKYLLFIMIASTIGFLLPLVGLLFAIPSFLSLYSSIGSL